MKTPPASTLQRSETGAYPGSIGGQGLSDQQRQVIRKILSQSSEPLMIGTIAAKAQIPMNTPTMQQSVSQFVSDYLVSTKEVERCLEGTSLKTGREIFRGFVATQHGKDLVEKGLA